ncbi:MAG: DNA polymerase IV [Patescibacteria group bacterium]|nr:DNA polymerase IV [Patescibacteria group bacterium]
MQRIILHFDMNSYFASVEQQANPFLRGKPVGVCSTMSKRGCIIASSKEAKAFGIKTGCRVNEALELNPDVQLVEVDPPKYRSTTKAIFSLCADYTESIEAYSIDEAFLDLTGTAQSFGHAKRMGQEIQRRIKNEIGEWLGSSMGISHTRWLAKFGSDTAPKGGIVVLTKENLYQYLVGRNLKEAWGIANALSARFNAIGIYTLDQLARYPVQNLMSVFGKMGYYLWANVNGIELSGLEEKRPPKTIGHSHVLKKRDLDRKFHMAVLMRLAERTGRRLREHGYEAHGFYYYVQFDGRPSFGGSKRVHHPIASTGQIFQLVWEQVAPVVARDKPGMFALGLFGLRPRVNQLELFTVKRLSPELSRAIDDINNRYGEETIVQGPLLKLDGRHAPDRVGFRKTVEAEFSGVSEYAVSRE